MHIQTDLPLEGQKTHLTVTVRHQYGAYPGIYGHLYGTWPLNDLVRTSLEALGAPITTSYDRLEDLIASLQR